MLRKTNSSNVTQQEQIDAEEVTTTIRTISIKTLGTEIFRLREALAILKNKEQQLKKLYFEETDALKAENAWLRAQLATQAKVPQLVSSSNCSSPSQEGQFDQNILKVKSEDLLYLNKLFVCEDSPFLDLSTEEAAKPTEKFKRARLE